MSERGGGTVVMREPAPAKLNLYLEVTGRRADGYHLLESLVVFVDVGDTIEVRPAPSYSLEIVGPFAGVLAAEPIETNLVTRAARRLAEALGRPAEVAIRLHKALPLASGIGGGSADAAATLRALARLWGIGPRDGRLVGIARSLGQDVPVCLAGRTAFFRGIGDETSEPGGAMPALDMLLVNPGVALATPDVFKARSGPFSTGRPFGAIPRSQDALIARLHQFANDLADPARRLAPVVGDVLGALAAAPGCELARMSGSGATCFGIFASADTSRSAARAINAAHPGWWVAATRTRF